MKWTMKGRSHAAVCVTIFATVSATVLVSANAYALGNDGVVVPPIDSATSQAFEMQRSGEHAGQALTMTGDQASAAYARYLKSFEAPIPTFFGSSLKSDVGSSGSSGSQ